MSEKETISTNVRFPKKLFERIKRESAKSHLSQNSFIITLIEAALDASELESMQVKDDFFKLAARFIAEKSEDDELKRDARRFAGIGNEGNQED